MPKYKRTTNNRPAEMHGMSDSSEYHIWRAMIQRTSNKNHVFSRHYLGRGITVCPEWRSSFVAFYRDMGPRPSPIHSIDRIDNDRGYEPGNVRWATPKMQRRNTRNTRYVTFRGETKPLVEWAEIMGIPKSRLQERIYRLGWTPERAFAEPPTLSTSGPGVKYTPEELRTRTLAAQIVRKAIVSGKLVRPDRCPKCDQTRDPAKAGAALKICAVHHRGFDRPHRLDVIWLCNRCRIEYWRNDYANRQTTESVGGR